MRRSGGSIESGNQDARVPAQGQAVWAWDGTYAMLCPPASTELPLRVYAPAARRRAAVEIRQVRMFSAALNPRIGCA